MNATCLDCDAPLRKPPAGPVGVLSHFCGEDCAISFAMASAHEYQWCETCGWVDAEMDTIDGVCAGTAHDRAVAASRDGAPVFPDGCGFDGPSL